MAPEYVVGTIISTLKDSTEITVIFYKSKNIVINFGGSKI
jgi:hypothetical protein